MTLPPNILLMSELPLPPATGEGAAPEWIHLLPAPADGLIRTADDRGPYRLARNAAELIAASFERADRIEIDLNHATYLAAPRGERSDAYGWIVEMQAREDGIWGRVEWTGEGRKLVSGRAYRGISPVLMTDKAKRILSIANASLVNRPNLRGLTALNQEGGMTLLQKLAGMCGLSEDATEDQVLAALKKKMGGDKPEMQAELQAQIAGIGAALGLKADATAEAVLAAAEAAGKGDGDGKVVAALQAELAEVGKELTALRDGRAREKAEAFVDGAVKAGRAGVKPLRDHYVEMHMQDPARVEREIGAMPLIGSGGRLETPAPQSKAGEIHLNAEQQAAARLLGLPADDYAATLKAEQEAAE